MKKSLRKRLEQFDVLPCVNQALTFSAPPQPDDQWLKAVCRSAALVKIQMLRILEEETSSPGRKKKKD